MKTMADHWEEQNENTNFVELTEGQTEYANQVIWNLRLCEVVFAHYGNPWILSSEQFDEAAYGELSIASEVSTFRFLRHATA